LMPGHGRPTSGERQELPHADSLSTTKDISVPATLLVSFLNISGNMILTPIPGRRKPTVGEQQETWQSDSPPTAKAISQPAVIFQLFSTISGNILRPAVSP